MAASPEGKKMQLALKEQVIPLLRQSGFKGSYPHFRRITPEKIEQVSFISPGIFGGGFEVGASIIFPTASRQDTNLFYPDDTTPPQKLVWGHGRIRFGLPGMFSGACYYTDLYAHYVDAGARSGAACFPFSRKMAEHGVNPTANGEVLVQQADEGIYDRVAAEAARQMRVLLEWFPGRQSPSDLRHYRDTHPSLTISD